jgi:NAD(P)-dependent dehydrogenase (short-subunit alcohol dehydrogenase family)
MLTDKVCVVTGGAAGIGRACAVEMAAQGAAAVAVVDLDLAGAEETARLVRERGADARALRCDIRDATAVAATMAAIGGEHGRIDVLHNNAGVLEGRVTDDTAVDALAEEVWDLVFDVNVKGTWLSTKYAVPWLRRSASAAIVNCGSTSAYVAFEAEAAYCTSKAAILGLTRSTAHDLAADGIRCTCYCPTSTETAMLDPAWRGADRAAAEAALTASHLVRRLGRPEDVAKLVCFLASDDAAFINGSAHMVDGGALAWRGLQA